MLRTSVKVAAVTLAAGIAVTACGGPVKMGAAAILGDQRISGATLSAEVSSLNAGYQQDKSKIQLQYPVAQMPQQVLSWLVRFRVRDQLAAREHITVTQSDIDRALNQISAQVSQGGGSTTLAAAAVANGLPPDLLTDLGRYQAIENAVIARLDGGTLPTAQAALQSLQTEFNASQCRASKSLDIEINPQFGQLDYGALSIVAAPSSLSATAGPAASPSASAKPQLTPPC